MRHRPTLSVPKPCHESWQAMTPAAQGRHCASCDKVVVDFTRMTDAEVLAYVGQSVGASCGRFRQEQLGRPLMVPLTDAGGLWRKRLLAAVALLGLGTAAAPAVRAQQVTPARTQQNIQLGIAATPAVSAGSELPHVVVRGCIVEKGSGQRLPGVIVSVPGTAMKTSTAADGTFELSVPQSAFSGKRQRLRIQATFIGYKAHTVTLKLRENSFLNVELQMEGFVLGELAYVQPHEQLPIVTTGGLWQNLQQSIEKVSRSIFQS